MRVIAIDPGPKESALVAWDGERVNITRFSPNEGILSFLQEWDNRSRNLAIEMIACYGMAVGAETFDTCVWIGRYLQSNLPAQTTLITRGEVKMHLCHTMKAKDANIRQALIDRFGAPGTKKNPGPLYGVKKHLWAALAVAVTYYDRQQIESDRTGAPRHAME